MNIQVGVWGARNGKLVIVDMVGFRRDLNFAGMIFRDISAIGTSFYPEKDDNGNDIGDLELAWKENGDEAGGTKEWDLVELLSPFSFRTIPVISDFSPVNVN